MKALKIQVLSASWIDKKECEFEIDRLVGLEDLRKFGVFYDS